MNKKILNLSFIFIIILCFVSHGYSQKKQDKDYKPTSLKEKIVIGTYFNSPSIYSSLNGTNFSFGLQPFVGYKFNKIITSGLTFKFDYLYGWSAGNSFSLTDLSTTLYTRATIAERFILQIEGGPYSDQSFINSVDKERTLFPVVYVGIGYKISPYSELLLSYEILGHLSKYRIPLDYKFGFIFRLDEV